MAIKGSLNLKRLIEREGSHRLHCICCIAQLFCSLLPKNWQKHSQNKTWVCDQPILQTRKTLQLDSSKHKESIYDIHDEWTESIYGKPF